MLHLALTKAIEESYSLQPSVVIMKHLFEAKEWLQDSIEEIHGHSEPLCLNLSLIVVIRPNCLLQDGQTDHGKIMDNY